MPPREWLSARTVIRVGPEYQAVIPDLIVDLTLNNSDDVDSTRCVDRPQVKEPPKKRFRKDPDAKEVTRDGVVELASEKESWITEDDFFSES